jgi:serine/threonine-protein kinase
VSFGPFHFDPNRRLLRKGAIEVPLPPRVLGVLELLLARAGDVVARQEIIDTVWRDAFVTDTSLAEAVSFLRQALGDDPQSPTYIQTVHRRGYRFLSPVSDSAALKPPETTLPEAAPAPAAIKPSIVNELLPWSVAIVAAVLAVSAVWYATRLEPVAPPVISLALDAGKGLRFDDRAPALAVSPSGARVAWSACGESGCQLYLRPLEQLTGQPIPDTAGAAAPFFSPDERWLGFFADGKLKKVALAGGAPQIIADASQPLGAAWMPDGRIVYAASTTGGLIRVREDGRDPEPFTTPSALAGEIGHEFPSAVRDRDALIFTVVTSPLPGAPGRLALLPYPAAGASWRTIAEAAEIGVAIGHEYVAFARGNEVHAVAFDRVRQAPAGVEQTVRTGALAPHIAASATGAFVSLVNPPPSQVNALPAWAWSGPGGKPIAAGLEDFLDARVSPDGVRIAAVGLDPRPDVWIVDLERGTRTRVTFGGPTAAPVWNAGGQDVLYAARRSAAYEIWARSATGTGDERRVLAIDDRHLLPSSVSRGGDLAFVRTGGPTRADVGVLRNGQSAPTLVVESPFDELAPSLSPDGASLAYQTDESGRWEIILVRLRDNRRSPVSTGGGVRPFWATDGRTLYFQQGDELMAVGVDSAGELAGGTRPVVKLNGATAAGIAPDGSILLHRKPPAGSSTAVLTLQWISELRAKLGPPTAASPR